MSPLESATTEELLKELAGRHRWLAVCGSLVLSNEQAEGITLLLHGPVMGISGAIDVARMSCNMMIKGSLVAGFHAARE